MKCIDCHQTTASNTRSYRPVRCDTCYVNWFQRNVYIAEGGIVKPKGFSFKYIVVGLLLGLTITAFPIACTALALGKTYAIRAPVCLTLEAAVALAKLDHEVGPQAVVASLQKNDGCGLDTFRAKVIRVHYQASTERGKDVRVVEVSIEMQDDTWKTFYILSDTPIEGQYQT